MPRRRDSVASPERVSLPGKQKGKTERDVPVEEARSMGEDMSSKRGGAAESAKEQSKQVADRAASEASQVADTTKDQARQVKDEAGTRASPRPNRSPEQFIGLVTRPTRWLLDE